MYTSTQTQRESTSGQGGHYDRITLETPQIQKVQQSGQTAQKAFQQQMNTNSPTISYETQQNYVPYQPFALQNQYVQSQMYSMPPNTYFENYYPPMHPMHSMQYAQPIPQPQLQQCFPPINTQTTRNNYTQPDNLSSRPAAPTSSEDFKLPALVPASINRSTLGDETKRSELSSFSNSEPKHLKDNKDKEKSLGQRKFRPYTLSDYKQLDMNVKLGSLGPSIDPDFIAAQKAKAAEMKALAEKVRMENQRRIVEAQQTALSKPTELEEEEKPNARQKAWTFAAAVPKPKIRKRWFNEEEIKKLPPNHPERQHANRQKGRQKENQVVDQQTLPIQNTTSNQKSQPAEPQQVMLDQLLQKQLEHRQKIAEIQKQFGI